MLLPQLDNLVRTGQLKAEAPAPSEIPSTLPCSKACMTGDARFVVGLPRRNTGMNYVKRIT